MEGRAGQALRQNAGLPGRSSFSFSSGVNRCLRLRFQSPRRLGSMDTPSPSTRDLARRLLAIEAASQSAANPRVHEAVRVFEKLRVSLTRFAGADAFTA